MVFFCLRLICCQFLLRLYCFVLHSVSKWQHSNNQVKPFQLYIELLNKVVEMLTVCASEIYERKYSNLSETSFALCKSMLPWWMFSFNSGLAEGGSMTLYNRNVLAIFIDLLFLKCFEVVGWGDFCLQRQNYSSNVYIRFVPLYMIKYKTLSVKSNLCLERVCSALLLKECNIHVEWFQVLFLNKVIEILIQTT